MNKLEKVICLNQEVLKEISEDKMLYVMWREIVGEYDWEIQPLHNPYWVRDRSKDEVYILERLKKDLKKYSEEFAEVSNAKANT